LAAGILMAGYLWLVGDEPSVQRAATMVTPLLAARFAGIRASPVAALALTVALWSVIDPVTAASVGFLLSGLATAAILIAAPPLAPRSAVIRPSRVAPRAPTLALGQVFAPAPAAAVGLLPSAAPPAAPLLPPPPLATALVELSGERIGRTTALVLAVPLVAQL